MGCGDAKEAGVGLGGVWPPTHPPPPCTPALPAGASVCSSGRAKGTVPHLFFYTLPSPLTTDFARGRIMAGAR
jgi:hypothetical protein